MLHVLQMKKVLHHFPAKCCPKFGPCDFLQHLATPILCRHWCYCNHFRPIATLRDVALGWKISSGVRPYVVGSQGFEPHGHKVRVFSAKNCMTCEKSRVAGSGSSPQIKILIFSHSEFVNFRPICRSDLKNSCLCKSISRGSSEYSCLYKSIYSGWRTASTNRAEN